MPRRPTRRRPAIPSQNVGELCADADRAQTHAPNRNTRQRLPLERQTLTRVPIRSVSLSAVRVGTQLADVLTRYRWTTSCGSAWHARWVASRSQLSDDLFERRGYRSLRSE